MGRHMGAVGQQRHGMIGKAASNLDHHEDGRDDGRPSGLCFGPRMAMSQEQMVAGPDSMTVAVFLAMPMIVSMVMPVVMSMQAVLMDVPMHVILRHDLSL